MKIKTLWMTGILISLGVLLLIFTFAIPIQKATIKLPKDAADVVLSLQITKDIDAVAKDTSNTEVVDQLNTPSDIYLETSKKNILIKLSDKDLDGKNIVAAYIRIYFNATIVILELKSQSGAYYDTIHWHIEYDNKLTETISIDAHDAYMGNPGLVVGGSGSYFIPGGGGSSIKKVNIKCGKSSDIIFLDYGNNVFVDGGDGKDICILPGGHFAFVENIY